jgi:hypothetical protein
VGVFVGVAVLVGVGVLVGVRVGVDVGVSVGPNNFPGLHALINITRNMSITFFTIFIICLLLFFD